MLAFARIEVKNSDITLLPMTLSKAALPSRDATIPTLAGISLVAWLAPSASRCSRGKGRVELHCATKHVTAASSLPV